MASTGTSHASASSAARPKLSRSDGTSTALAALTYCGTWAGSTCPSASSGTSPASAERPVVALLRAVGVGREQQVRTFGLQSELSARLRSRDRAEAIGGDAGGEDRAPAPQRPSRDLARERLGHGRDEVEPGQRRERDRARAGMRKVGAVEGHRMCRSSSRERGPRGQPEVSVDDVVPPFAAAPFSQVGGGAKVGLPASRREREDVDVDPLDPAERVDLVADEAPEGGPGRGRVHVRDDQGAHRGRGETSGPRASRARGLPGGASGTMGPRWHLLLSTRSGCSTRASAG